MTFRTIETDRLVDWEKLDAIVTTGLGNMFLADDGTYKLGTSNVTSVNWKVWVVVLDKTDIWLWNVDNTSDVDKPISTATQTALDGKVDENSPITGATKTKITYDAKWLVTAGADATTADIADSTNKRYVTDADLVDIGNLSGVNTGDQNLFGIIAVSGQSNVVADSTNDTLTLAAGANISITTNAATDTVTISATWVWSWDVTSNTATSVDSEIALFNGTTGKQIKRATTTWILKWTSWVIWAAIAWTDYTSPTWSESITNKTISLWSNTVSGTKAQFNTACTDGDFVFVWDIWVAWVTSTVTSGSTTLTAASTDIQEFTWSTSTNITLPVTSTLFVGRTFKIINKSTAATLVVLSSGANSIATLYVNESAEFICKSTSGTTAASWTYVFEPTSMAVEVGNFISTPTTANLVNTVGWAGTGTGNLVLSNSPTLVTPALGTPSSATLTNATGLPISTWVSGLWTWVATFLATPSSANLAAALTDETGTGANVFANSPTLVTPNLWTPSTLVATNATGTATGLTAWDSTKVGGITISWTPSVGYVPTATSSSAATWQAPSSSSSFWTLMPGTPTRVGNTSFTVTWDVTAYVAKGMVIKWTESSTVRTAMVSIPSTFSSPNTTITIVGDTMASIDASSLKYAQIWVEAFMARFAIAGTIGATTTGWDAAGAANAYYATEPMRVLAADLQVGTAWTTNNTTIDFNKNATTMFTTKPTLATTVASSPTPFTADSATSLALGDKVTIDIDAIQTTAAIDLYAQLYLWPTRFNSLP